MRSEREVTVPLSVSVEGSPPARRAVLRGDVDVVTAPQARRRLSDALDADLVLDLSGIEFIDSSGVNLLVGLRKSLSGAGHRLVLERPSDGVVEVLRAMSLDGVLLAEPPE